MSKTKTRHWTNNMYLFAVRYYCLLLKSGGLSCGSASQKTKEDSGPLLLAACGNSLSFSELVKIYHHDKILPEPIPINDHGKVVLLTAEEHILRQLSHGGKESLKKIGKYKSKKMKTIVEKVLEFYNNQKNVPKSDVVDFPPLLPPALFSSTIPKIKNGKEHVRVTIVEGSANGVIEVMERLGKWGN